MAFNKVFLVTLLLLVVTTIANARGDLLKDSSIGLPEEFFCSSCACTGTAPTRPVCQRYERKVGGCPLTCGEPCACTRSIPPTCWCSYRVESCNPPQCPNILGAGMAELEMILLGASVQG